VMDFHSGSINVWFESFKGVWKVGDKVGVGSNGGKSNSSGKGLGKDITASVGTVVCEKESKGWQNRCVSYLNSSIVLVYFLFLNDRKAQNWTLSIVCHDEPTAISIFPN
jgi:hypothetical protein